MSKIPYYAIILSIFFTSCINGDEDSLVDQQIDDQRKEFLIGKTQEQIVNDYLSLDFDQQKKLWISKLNQILNSIDSEKHNILVSNLKSEFVSTKSLEDFYDNHRIKEISIDLAKITSLENMILLFSDLNDFNEIDKLSEKNSCQSCVASLTENWRVENIDFRVLADCNCRWTCDSGDDKLNCSTTDCSSSSTGCGFFLLQSCTGRNVNCSN